MNNVISLCDYRQRKLDDLLDAEIEEEWTLTDAMVASILVADEVRILSIMDNCDTTTITLTISDDKNLKD